MSSASVQSPMAHVPRALRGDEEIDAQYRLAVETFMRPEVVEPVAAAFRRFDERSAGLEPEGIRGVVEDGTLLGGYFVWERMMCMGAVRLPTACIGGVVTRQDQRMRGVGRALMEDAIAYATRREQALLLLDGVPNFYSRFGYTDIFDQAALGIDRGSIADEPVTGHRVRPAVLDDAPALHDLYHRHFGPYMGSFHWTLAEKRMELDFDLERGEEPAVVEDDSGAVRGYLYTDGDTNNADEAAADTWPALLALLQHHAPAAAGPPDEEPALWWQIPPDSHTAYLLAEYLVVPDDRKAAVLRHRSRVRRNADWQARPAHLPTLIRAVLPLWQQRWERSNRAVRRHDRAVRRRGSVLARP